MIPNNPVYEPAKVFPIEPVDVKVLASVLREVCDRLSAPEVDSEVIIHDDVCRGRALTIKQRELLLSSGPVTHKKEKEECDCRCGDGGVSGSRAAAPP